MSGETVTVTMRDGRQKRWGTNELDAAHALGEFSFDTEIPGGFGPGTVSVPIESRYDPQLFASVLVHSDAGEPIYEGRITGYSESDSLVSLECEGWVAHLSDDQTASTIFIDRDLTRWSGPSVQRQISLIAFTLQPHDPSTDPDVKTGQAALKTEVESPWSTIATCEGWYDAGQGNRLGSLYYAWKKGAAVSAAAGPPTWYWGARLSDDDLLTNNDSTGTLRAAGPGTGTLNATAARRWAVVELYYSAASPGGTGLLYPIYWTCLAAYGDHGIAKQGAGSAVEAPGLLGSDCIAYAVGRWAPLLNFTTGVGGSIDPTSYAIQHLAFYDQVTARDMVEATNIFGGSGYALNDWGVYDDREFFCRPPGSYGNQWRVRKDEGVRPASSGPDSQEALNGVVVRYDDGSGSQFTVGPPGSGATLESAALASDDPSNQANNDGARHWATYDAGITSQAGALLIGQLVLAEASASGWRGSVEISGDVRRANGSVLPASLVRAGDWIVVEDDDDTRPRKIVNTSYAGGAVSCSIGRRPDVLDIVLARAGVALVGRT